MRTLFHPFLPNGPSGDPLLWVDLMDEGESLLIDLGDLHVMAARKLLRVSRALVTHTHLDHFIGFDRLLRVVLGRERELVLAGPPGLCANVAGKLAGYSWNLVRDYPVRLRVEEIDGDVVRSVVFAGATGLAAEVQPSRPWTGLLHAEPSYTIEAAVLDHGIPVIGWALRETEHLGVDRDALLRLGLRADRWLGELRAAARTDPLPPGEIEVPLAAGGSQRLARRDLAAALLRRSRGQLLAYVTDMAGTADNLTRAAALARGAQLLVCETAFLEEDRALALARNHLTAQQAGELARAAGAERLAPFHFSSRYEGREQELLSEAARAFGGPVLCLDRGFAIVPGDRLPNPR